MPVSSFAHRSVGTVQTDHSAEHFAHGADRAFRPNSYLPNCMTSERGIEPFGSLKSRHSDASKSYWRRWMDLIADDG